MTQPDHAHHKKLSRDVFRVMGGSVKIRITKQNAILHLFLSLILSLLFYFRSLLLFVLLFFSATPHITISWCSTKFLLKHLLSSVIDFLIV